MPELTRDAVAAQLQTIILADISPDLEGSTWKFSEEQRLNDPIDGPGLNVFDLIVLKDIVVEWLGGVEFEERWEDDNATFKDVINDIIGAASGATMQA